MSQYGDTKKCAELPAKVFEATFYYPGPSYTRTPPALIAQREWDKAKEVCIECPVFLECRDKSWGEEFGVVGGTDQYERYLYRRKLQRRLHVMTIEQRAELAASLYNRYGGGYRHSVAEIARFTGYSVPAVRALLTEHQAAVDAAKGHVRAERTKREDGRFTPEERERLASMVAKGVSMRWMRHVFSASQPVIEAELAALQPPQTRPDFPAGDPSEGDGWVWHHGMPRTAQYRGETPDGRFFYMTLRAQNKSPTRAWFAAELVDLRAKVQPIIMERSAAA